jgi:hypothetical protein
MVGCGNLCYSPFLTAMWYDMSGATRMNGIKIFRNDVNFLAPWMTGWEMLAL